MVFNLYFCHHERGLKLKKLEAATSRLRNIFNNMKNYENYVSWRRKIDIFSKNQNMKTHERICVNVKSDKGKITHQFPRLLNESGLKKLGSLKTKACRILLINVAHYNAKINFSICKYCWVEFLIKIQFKWIITFEN